MILDHDSGVENMMMMTRNVFSSLAGVGGIGREDALLASVRWS